MSEIKHQNLAKLNLDPNLAWCLKRLDTYGPFKWLPIGQITSVLENNLPNPPKFIVEPKPMGMDFFPGAYAIYRAYEPGEERIVALKIASTENGDVNKDVATRLENEFEVLKDAEHPGLPRVYELIVTQTELEYSATRVDKKDIPILVMELLEGVRLDYELANLTKEQMIKIAGDIASTGDYLNLKLGRAHGDIKSANVLLTPEQTKIIDLGNTKGGQFSTYYSAPELAAGVKPNHSSDIYSFAVVVYEMIGNGVPFQIEYDKEKGIEIDPATNRVYKPLTVEQCVRLSLSDNQVVALNMLFRKTFSLPEVRPETAGQFFREFRAILN